MVIFSFNGLDDKPLPFNVAIEDSVYAGMLKQANNAPNEAHFIDIGPCTVTYGVFDCGTVVSIEYGVSVDGYEVDGWIDFNKAIDNNLPIVRVDQTVQNLSED